MKILDTFLFYNEYDLLELRLRELYNSVDQFVIVEGDRTFTGIYKGFNLEQHLDRYKPWADKINYIKVTDCPTTSSPTSPEAWRNEFWLRDQMNRGWQNLGPNDVVLAGDIDEIPRTEAIDFIRNTNYDMYQLYMPLFYFKFNYMDPNVYEVLTRGFRGWQLPAGSLRKLPEYPGKTRAMLDHAGWHFSYVGDNEFIKTKIKSFSHVELNTPEMLASIDVDTFIAQGQDHFRKNMAPWHSVNLDNYFPKTIVNNLEKYKHFVLPDSGRSVFDLLPGQIASQRY